jgi:hypothetical protein
MEAILRACDARLPRYGVGASTMRCDNIFEVFWQAAD